MRYNEEEYLALSGLQHFSFCRRQWALIHIENQWAENLLTTEGKLMHERAHDMSIRERRDDILTVRGVNVSSPTLGISGQCDVIEFHTDPSGIHLSGEDGTWTPYPVEYKHGKSKANLADRLQLCAQAMCLEEMLCCDISEGALFYGETRCREIVAFDPELRESVETMLKEMHQLFTRGYTPKVKQKKACNSCSLKEMCLPEASNVKSVADYMADAMQESI